MCFDMRTAGNVAPEDAETDRDGDDSSDRRKEGIVTAKMDEALRITIERLFQASSVWPVIVSEQRTGRVIALQEVNEEAFRRTVESGTCWYWDSVNETIYLKGEHSNEIETIREIRLDICHARRHLRTLRYLVELAPGKCLFGMSRCDFYRFDGRCFTPDPACVIDEAACKAHWDRVNTLLNEDEDREHQRRFSKRPA